MAKKAQSTEPTAEQQQTLQAVGIDWKNIDWTKMLGILQLIMSLFTKQPPVMQSHDGEDHVHEECCLATLQAQMAALQCCLDHYDKCCDGNGH